MLETVATPTEAPNSWKVLSRPEAIPASSGPICPSAVAAATTNSAPMPKAPKLMPIVVATVVGHKAGTIRPMAAMSMPAAPRVRAPRRAIRRPPRLAPVIVASAIGRNSKPVVRGPCPANCWK